MSMAYALGLIVAGAFVGIIIGFIILGCLLAKSLTSRRY